ncbi:RteC domain-containing protein [Myroides marinus]|uniref:RteC domain-containing protein n=1 Tax=Myroides marinus TaxID=703342 RepID=UPI002575B3DD|nr:RteC domain-containing protein [Myroides marinus]
MVELAISHPEQTIDLIKPQILGKLIFYNKLYSIETSCPIDTVIKNKYYHKHPQELNLEYKKYFAHNEFYKYYNADRTDKDIEYFTLGKTDLLIGSNSFIFEIDPLFSTYYDYKIARIVAHDLLQNYLHEKILEFDIHNNQILSSNLVWSESQNALIELIYALYLSGSINNGKGEIRKIAVFFQQLFGIKLLEIHHAFHRMKTRAKSKTSYLDKLKEVLEEYMDKE